MMTTNCARPSPALQTTPFSFPVVRLNGKPSSFQHVLVDAAEPPAVAILTVAVLNADLITLLQ